MKKEKRNKPVVKKSQDAILLDYLDNSVDNAQEFFVAVAVSDDGKEGVISVIEPAYLGKEFPIERVYMGATTIDRDAIIKKCKKNVKKIGKKIRVLRFSQREVIEEINP
jgi:hypothetical protein